VLLLDLHPFLNHPVTVRALKDLALASGTVLREEITRQRTRSGRDVAGCQRTLESLQRHLTGLPEASVRHLARLALGDGQVTAADLARVLAAKQTALGAGELLVFEPDLPSMDQVAGMVALKRWLLLRRVPFLDPGAAVGLPPPKGLLLLGVQGGGKSLAAKAVAASWQLPLFRMDFGALHDKWQGESERKLRDALRVAEAMQPCVLWMDEVEKGLAGGGGDDGTGATRRMLGTLLTWMVERRSRVFLVATANDIQALPPELVRKGRFDEIFFVDLPDEAARAELMRIHLGRLQVAFDDSDLPALVVASLGFSGAEIAAAAVATRYEALALGRNAGAAAMLAELARTKPLSVTRAESVAALRAWAADRAVPAG
jgi:SpoVK/Ycf46/Vps4 family AAA+-type ATPase